MNKPRYFSTCLKRMLKQYLPVLAVTVMLCVLLGIIGLGAINKIKNGSEYKKVAVAVVGDTTENYLGIGIRTIETMDTSQYEIEFIETDAQTAEEMLVNRKIVAYVIVPDDFIDRIGNSSENLITYVSLPNNEGFGAIVIKSFAKSICDIIAEGEAGINAYVQYARKSGCESKTLSEQGELINIDYIRYVIGRNQAFDISVLGIRDKLTLGGYYACGVTVFLLLIWGVACNGMIKRNDHARYLFSRGISPARQVLCEYFSFAIITFATVVLFAICSGIALSLVTIGISELDGRNVVDMLLCACGLLPAVLALSALEYLIFNAIPSRSGAILFSFVSTAVMCYASGCFYPKSYFPDIVQDVGAYLPTGVAFSYIGGLLSGESSLLSLALLVLYALVFILAAVLVRDYGIRKVGD